MGKIYTDIYKDNKQTHVKTEKLQEYLDNGWKIGKLKPAWNKGLTKETDERVKKYGESQKGRHLSNETKQKLSKKFKGRKLSKETLEKRSNTVRGRKQSEESKRKRSQSLMGHKVSKEQIEKQRQTMFERYGGWVFSSRPTVEGIKRISEHNSSKEFQIYQRNKKIENGTINSSKPENDVYNLLLNKFEVVRYYSDDRYPFECDFYIKSLDLFIECNFHWTHGGKPYIENDEQCINQLSKWKEKAKKSKFYENAIKTWTIRDVSKLKKAKENNLNYLIFYNYKEMLSWYEASATYCGKYLVDSLKEN